MPGVTDTTILAPFAATVIAIAHEPEEPVSAGEAVVVLEAMKMEHEVLAEVDGVVARIEVAVGDTVDEGQALAVLVAGGPGASRESATGTEEPSPDLGQDAVSARLRRMVARRRQAPPARRRLVIGRPRRPGATVGHRWRDRPAPPAIPVRFLHSS
jgi:pyruvate/2-oxoglutarate dehydrogenase complex dihydrolipoamide acyltransferase (E2) component